MYNFSFIWTSQVDQLSSLRDRVNIDMLHNISGQTMAYTTVLLYSSNMLTNIVGPFNQAMVTAKSHCFGAGSPTSKLQNSDFLQIMNNSNRTIALDLNMIDNNQHNISLLLANLDGLKNRLNELNIGYDNSAVQHWKSELQDIALCPATDLAEQYMFSVKPHINIIIYSWLLCDMLATQNSPEHQLILNDDEARGRLTNILHCISGSSQDITNSTAKHSNKYRLTRTINKYINKTMNFINDSTDNLRSIGQDIFSSMLGCSNILLNIVNIIKLTIYISAVFLIILLNIFLLVFILVSKSAFIDLPSMLFT